MERRLIVTADDYGLSSGNVTTILEAVDHGAVTNLSILANGDAVERGIEEYAKRADHLGLSVHINLTEGKRVSEDSAARILTDEKGMFRYSVGRLWFAYLFSGSKKREKFRAGVRIEIGAQIARIRSLLKPYDLDVSGADGHQHVHMVPFVFDALSEQRLPYVRITHEPWYVVPHHFLALFGVHAIARFPLVFLSFRNRRAAKKRGILSNEFFLGFVFSGKMTYEATKEGLYAVTLHKKAKAIDEMCFHPGSAIAGELDHWTNANTAWHYSKWRGKERTLLASDAFKMLCSDFASGNLIEKHWYRGLPKLGRFVIAGGTAAVTQLILLFIFTEYTRIWYLASNALAFCFSFLVSFTLQKLWTFEDSSHGNWRGQASHYLVLQLASLGINSLLLSLLVERLGIGYLAAEFFVLILVAFGTFFISKKLIFRRLP